MLKNKFFREDTKVIISDIKDPLLHFAECCTPIPGDKIIAFAGANEVHIHQAQCDKFHVLKEQLLNVSWDMPKDELNTHYLKLHVMDQQGVLYQITKIINDAKTSIEHIDSQRHGPQKTILHLKLSPISWKDYHKIVEGIRNLKLVKQFL